MLDLSVFKNNLIEETYTADLWSAHHLNARIVNVEHVFQHDLIVIQLDAFCHAGDGEKLLFSKRDHHKTYWNMLLWMHWFKTCLKTFHKQYFHLVFVKLNGRDDARVVEHISCVAQSCQGPQVAVTSELAKAVGKFVQTGKAWIILIFWIGAWSDKTLDNKSTT